MLYTRGVLSSLREVIAKRSFLPLIRHSRTSSRMPPSLKGRLGESADVTLGFLCDTSAGSFRLLLRKIHLPLGGRQKERRTAISRKAPCGGSWRRRRLRENADVTFKPSPVGSAAARECKKTTECCFPSSVTEPQRERGTACGG